PCSEPPESSVARCAWSSYDSGPPVRSFTGLDARAKRGEVRGFSARSRSFQLEGTPMRMAYLASMAALAALIAGTAPAFAAGGCGYGWHRNIYGNCRPNGPGWGGVVVAPGYYGYGAPGYWHGGYYRGGAYYPGGYYHGGYYHGCYHQGGGAHWDGGGRPRHSRRGYRPGGGLRR